MKRFALFFLFLLLFVNTAIALDFTAAGDTDVNAFRCYTVEKELFVSNPESSATSISLSVGGSAAGFVKFSDLSLDIAPGQTKSFTAFYEVPCEAEEGSYDLDVYFTGLDSQKILSQTINVLTPDSLFIIADPAVQEIDPCGVASYKIMMKNPTNINESYFLKLDEFIGEYRIDDEGSFSIEGYGNKSLTLKISPEDCEKTGEFKFNLVASTDKTELVKRVPLALKMKSVGIPEIAAGVERIRTDYNEKEAPVKIKNLGSEDVTYDVKVEGIDWISAPEKLSIKANSEASVNLLFKPEESIEVGEYNLKLRLNVPESSATYTKNFTVLLKPFSLVERKPHIIYIPLIIIIVVALIIGGFILFSRSKAYRALKQETMKKRAKKKSLLQKKKVKLSEKKLDRLKRREALKKRKFELKEKRIEEKLRKREQKRKLKALLKEKKKKEKLERIAAKEKAKKSLKTEITNKIKAQFKLIPKANILRGDKPRDSKFGWIVFIIIALLLMLLFRLFGLIIVLVIVLVLIFTEFRYAKCFVRRWKFLEKGVSTHLSTNWKLGIYAFNLVTLKNVEKLALTVKKFASKVNDVKCFMGFSVSSNVENAVKLGNVKFRVSKRWFKRCNVSLDHFKLLKRVKEGWKKQKTSFIKADKDFYYFSAEKLGVGEFALVGKPSAKKPKKRFNIFWIAIIGVIALFFLQPTLSIKGIPAQTWQKDTQHSIKLSQYFHDPDLDRLKFAADETENINITFDNDLALLNPAPSWTGEEYTKFHAVDPAGEIASSNNVKLIVKDTVAFGRGLTWINIIVLALLLFLVILALFEKKLN